MPDGQIWDIVEASALADTWQEKFTGKAMPEGFFPQIHALAEYLHDNGQVQRAVALLQSENSMGVSRFLGHRLEHARLLSRALFDAGNPDEALQLVEYYGSRPYLFDDLNKLGYFLFCRSAHCLATHDALNLAHCVTLLVETQAGMKDANLIRIIQQAGGIDALIRAAESLNFSTRMLLRVFGLAQRLAGKGVAAGIIGRGLHFGLNILRSISRLKGGNLVGLLPRRTPPSNIRSKGHAANSHPIVVTRAMGGIGDLLMMTPGLKALARKHPDREIWFAIPKRFHQLFLGFDRIKTVDIDHLELYQENCFILYNLTECPASKVESAEVPFVKRNRIDIFSRALGIKDLTTAEKKPIYTVTNQERQWAEQYLASIGVTPKNFLAVQPYAADSYRNYPDIKNVIYTLAKNYSVLIFHGSSLPNFSHPNIHNVDSLKLRQSISILSFCKILITVDSSFLHLGAALGIKTVALFGPIGGHVRAGDYPNCSVIDAYAETGCRACWRWQGLMCAKTNNTSSLCMERIPQDKIYGLVASLANPTVDN